MPVHLAKPNVRIFNRRCAEREVYGTAESFEQVGPDRSIATIQPQKGWGATMIATYYDGSPVVGAEVILDGKVVARTNSDGRANVQREVFPNQITLKFEGQVGRHSRHTPDNAILRFGFR